MWNNLLLKLTLESGSVVPGECEIVGYEGRIEIEKVEFTIVAQQQQQVDVMEPGQAKFQAARQLLEARMQAMKAPHRSVTRPSLGQLTVEKRYDAASAALLKALRNADRFKEADFLALRRSTLGVKMKPMAWLRLTLKKVEVQSIDLKLAKVGEGLMVQEDLKLDYDELAIEYMPPRAAGTLRFSHVRSDPAR